MPTHGSLTKAGKVRGQTPKIEGKPRSSLVSKSRNKNNFIKRFEKRRLPGHNITESIGRRYTRFMCDKSTFLLYMKF